MSKPVRIKDWVASQVEVVAAEERRSFANTVELLLHEAIERRGLAERDGDVAERKRAPTGESPGSTPGVPGPRSASPSGVPATIPVVGRAHKKKNRPAIECRGEVEDGVCLECGAELT